MISGFNGSYRFLSNFYPCVIEFEGRVYNTVEHAYQAAKTLDDALREHVAMSSSPGIAKRAGRGLALRPDWEAVKQPIMQALLRKKFYDPVLRAALVQTGEEVLEETNYWHDQSWGNCICEEHKDTPGKNLLGCLLMELRGEFIASIRPVSVSSTQSTA